MLATLRQAARAALALLAGERCVMCGQPLLGAQLCPSCWLALPYTHLCARLGNPIDRLFWDDARVVAASAFLWYKPQYSVARVVHALKYGGRYDLGILLGQTMAQELLSCGFFATADALLPVPLSQQRYRQRGYNQSEALAQGVSRVTGLPILEDAVRRHIDNPSQTQLDATQRLQNVEGIFSLHRPDALAGKHLVLIDDVVTIGATLNSLMHTLHEVPNVRFSVLVLCAAGRYHVGAVSPQLLNLPDHSASLRADRLQRYRP